MNGLGDAIYHRPFIRDLSSRAGLSLDTKYPEMFSDLPVAFARSEAHDIRPHYTSRQLALGSIVQAIGRHFPPVERFVFDLPRFPSPVSGRYAVVRVASLRQDFHGPARNPKAEYLNEAAAILKALGFVTVSVGNLRQGLEWADGVLPETDLSFVNGELSVPELLGLISGASVVIGGPGYQAPACLAYRTPCVVVYGGAGALNRLDKLTDPRIEGARLSAVEPDRFCNCRLIGHDCDKQISGFSSKFKKALHDAMH
jgi:hypothetical protein